MILVFSPRCANGSMISQLLYILLPLCLYIACVICTEALKLCHVQNKYISLSLPEFEFCSRCACVRFICAYVLLCEDNFSYLFYVLLYSEHNTSKQFTFYIPAIGPHHNPSNTLPAVQLLPYTIRNTYGTGHDVKV